MQSQATDVVFEVREAGESGDEWQELICAIDDQGELDNEVSETVTRCGTFTGVQDATATYSGNAAADSDPTVNQATLLDVQTWQKNKTLLDFRYYNKASGAIAAGQILNNQGTGRFTNTQPSAPSGEVVQFAWTFTPTGEVLIGETIVDPTV